eukprot:scaffold2123_cov96-Cylindrotheca_fusiformis.AAC.10
MEREFLGEEYSDDDDKGKVAVDLMATDASDKTTTYTTSTKAPIPNFLNLHGDDDMDDDYDEDILTLPIFQPKKKPSSPLMVDHKKDNNSPKLPPSSALEETNPGPATTHDTIETAEKLSMPTTTAPVEKAVTATIQASAPAAATNPRPEENTSTTTLPATTRTTCQRTLAVPSKRNDQTEQKDPEWKEDFLHSIVDRLYSIQSDEEKENVTIKAFYKSVQQSLGRMAKLDKLQKRIIRERLSDLINGRVLLKSHPIVQKQPSKNDHHPPTARTGVLATPAINTAKPAEKTTFNTRCCTSTEPYPASVPLRTTTGQDETLTLIRTTEKQTAPEPEGSAAGQRVKDSRKATESVPAASPSATNTEQNQSKPNPKKRTGRATLATAQTTKSVPAAKAATTDTEGKESKTIPKKLPGKAAATPETAIMMTESVPTKVKATDTQEKESKANPKKRTQRAAPSVTVTELAPTVATAATDSEEKEPKPPSKKRTRRATPARTESARTVAVAATDSEEKESKPPPKKRTRRATPATLQMTESTSTTEAATSNKEEKESKPNPKKQRARRATATNGHVTESAPIVVPSPIVDTEEQESMPNSKKRTGRAPAKTAAPRKRGYKKGTCALCTTCPCQKPRGGDDETTTLSDSHWKATFSRSDVAMEKALIRRLQKMEKSAENLEGQTDLVRRKLKKHRRQVQRMKMKKLPQVVADNTCFLPDAHEFDDLGSNKVADESVQKAQHRVFPAIPAGKLAFNSVRVVRFLACQLTRGKQTSSGGQQTLTQLGFPSTKSVDGTKHVDSGESSSPVQADTEAIEPAEDTSMVVVEDISEEVNSEDDDQISVEAADEAQLPLPDVVDQVERFRWRNGTKSQEGSMLHSQSVWGVLVPIQEEGEEEDDERSMLDLSSQPVMCSKCPWDRLFTETTSTGDEDDVDESGIDQLLNLLERPPPAVSSQMMIVPSTSSNIVDPPHNHDDCVDPVLPSMLSQGGREAVNQVCSTVDTDMERLAAINRVCPQWKENVAYAFVQTDPEQIQDALDNVRKSRLKMLETKRKILEAWDRHQIALDVMETSLESSLCRSKSKGGPLTK